MTEYQTSSFAAASHNNALTNAVEPRPEARVAAKNTEVTVDFIKEQAFSQGYDRAIKDVMEIINKQQAINDTLGRINGEDLHVIRTKIKEMYL